MCCGCSMTSFQSLQKANGSQSFCVCSNEGPLSLHVSFLFSKILQVILSTSSFQISMVVITYMDNQSNIFVCKKLYVCSVFSELNHTIGMNEVSSLA
jgi:hypothetical protein